MHWTQQTLWLLCAACVALNWASWAVVRQVRTVGVLVCSAWVLQQTEWLAGRDPLLLCLICDALLFVWIISRTRAPDAIECAVALLAPATVFCYSWQHFFGSVPVMWWANWYMVAAQMLIGLPWAIYQKSLTAYSHGTSKRPKEA